VTACVGRLDPGDGEAIEAELLEIDRHARQGSLPAVPAEYSPFAPPCVWKLPERTRRCPFWETCWGGQDDELPAEVQGQLREIVDEYAALWTDKHRAEAEAEAVARIMEAKRDQLERVFAAVGAKSLLGSTHTVTRVEQKGRTSVDLDKAAAAGAVDLAALEPFTKHGEPVISFRVRPAKAAKAEG
jgi:hypothetical protein